jgi:hypothetical protein
VQKPQTVSSFVYVGPLNPRSQAVAQKPLTPESARVVALGAWRLDGRLRPVAHFKKRMKQRKFSILDIEEVLRRGRPKGNGRFCPDHRNYKYEFQGSVDGVGLRVVFAIDATQDYMSAPLVILITAAWNTKSGIRRR